MTWFHGWLLAVSIMFRLLGWVHPRRLGLSPALHVHKGILTGKHSQSQEAGGGFNYSSCPSENTWQVWQGTLIRSFSASNSPLPFWMSRIFKVCPPSILEKQWLKHPRAMFAMLRCFNPLESSLQSLYCDGFPRLTHHFHACTPMKVTNIIHYSDYLEIDLTYLLKSGWCSGFLPARCCPAWCESCFSS